MPFKLYTIPILDTDSEMIDDMNKFVRSHVVLDVKTSIVALQTQAYYCYSIEYSEKSTGILENVKANNAVDYKDKLSPDAFSIFLLLKEVRLIISEGKKNLPIYAVFTNKELADIAELIEKSNIPEISITDLKKVNGIGQKKVENFGSKLLELFYPLYNVKQLETFSDKTEEIADASNESENLF